MQASKSTKTGARRKLLKSIVQQLTVVSGSNDDIERGNLKVKNFNYLIPLRDTFFIPTHFQNEDKTTVKVTEQITKSVPP